MRRAPRGITSKHLEDAADEHLGELSDRRHGEGSAYEEEHESSSEAASEGDDGRVPHASASERRPSAMGSRPDDRSNNFRGSVGSVPPVDKVGTAEANTDRAPWEKPRALAPPPTEDIGGTMEHQVHRFGAKDTGDTGPIKGAIKRSSGPELRSGHPGEGHHTGPEGFGARIGRPVLESMHSSDAEPRSPSLRKGKAARLIDGLMKR